MEPDKHNTQDWHHLFAWHSKGETRTNLSKPSCRTQPTSHPSGTSSSLPNPSFQCWDSCQHLSCGLQWPDTGIGFILVGEVLKKFLLTSPQPPRAGRESKSQTIKSNLFLSQMETRCAILWQKKTVSQFTICGFAFEIMSGIARGVSYKVCLWSSN